MPHVITEHVVDKCVTYDSICFYFKSYISIAYLELILTICCKFNLPSLTAIIIHTRIFHLMATTSAIPKETDQAHNTRKTNFPVCYIFDTNTTTKTICYV